MIRYLSTVKANAINGTALVRLDFNTEGDWRIRAVLPTIQFLSKTADKVVIVSHKGRPAPLSKTKLAQAGEGRTTFDPKFSLEEDAGKLSKLLKKEIIFISHFDFKKMKEQIAAAPRGTIFLLENLRFDAGEEKNDPKFARELASIADFYVNDAFPVDHRANASVVAVTKFLPSYAGFELEKEIVFLSKAIQKPKHPVVFIVGGAKAADKLAVISYFKNKADRFLLGGGAANTILSLRGMYIGKSLADMDPKDRKAMSAIAKWKNISMPDDYTWSDGRILDIGPRAIRQFEKAIAGAKTIIWSGPLGMIEKEKYAKGSFAVAKAIARNKKAFSLTGGGETVTFLKKHKLDTKFTFVSTGGGAMLDFLAGKKLPGIEALK